MFGDMVSYNRDTVSVTGHYAPQCIYRRQDNGIYLCELFLAAHFSQKIEKRSDGSHLLHMGIN